MRHAVIGHAVMGHAVMGHAVMGHAVMGHAVMGHAVISINNKKGLNLHRTRQDRQTYKSQNNCNPVRGFSQHV
jgi:hypothetical protein